ncbi:hypothetical protein EB796_020556 [Bugula neritina]|uniref:GPR180-like N-terminal domain-containing protein n=1 Tax=Bugula neritina TaxID=10212 RepID=A0A7J7J5Y7_BUGNE|nr:hypothetical protein EB796_020556 [Bugula neritina]
MILNMAASALQRCTIRSLFSTILLLLNLKYANPLHANGILMTTGDSASNWEFLTRFCFLSKVGRFEFELSYPQKFDLGYNAAQNILLYSDLQWPSVYPRPTLKRKKMEEKPLSCYDKESVLVPEYNQVINLTTRYRWSGCRLQTIAGEPWYTCKGGRTFASSRERWWYVVVSNCASEQGLYLNYSITMTNSLSNDTFFKHFSADEFYIIHETIGFLVAYTLLMVLSLYVACK